MYKQTHAEIKTASNLAASLQTFDWTAANNEDYVPKKARRSSKSRKEGGERVAIMTDTRLLAERWYRRKAKLLTAKAANDESIIVTNISKCRTYDWRW